MLGALRDCALCKGLWIPLAAGLPIIPTTDVPFVPINSNAFNSTIILYMLVERLRDFTKRRGFLIMFLYNCFLRI